MLLETRVLPPGCVPLPNSYVSHGPTQAWNQTEMPLTARHPQLSPDPVSPGVNLPPGEGRATAQSDKLLLHLFWDFPLSLPSQFRGMGGSGIGVYFGRIPSD